MKTASNQGDVVSQVSAGERGAAVASDDDARPSARRQVFASVMTPNWCLGLLLFTCLVLPSFRGCNDQVIYVGRVVTEVEPTLSEVYLTFLMIWPYLFGLLVAVGTIRLAISGDPTKAGRLWWPLASLVALNTVLFAVGVGSALITSGDLVRTVEELLQMWWLVASSVAAIVLVLLTARRRRRHPFASALWLQCGLAVLAAVSVSCLTPVLLWAKEILIGGLLAIACAVFLILTSVVTLLDGSRALSRKVGQSPLQLSMRAMLMLMLLGGVACCWVGTFLVADIPAEEEAAPSPPVPNPAGTNNTAAT